MSTLFYIFASISITFSSMIFGALINEAIKKKDFYSKLSNFQWIKSDRMNQLIGVGVMKFLVSKTFWNKFNTKLKLGKKADTVQLKQLKTEMTYAEISHLIGFLLVVFISFYLFVFDSPKFGVILMLVNTIFNLYPSLLQQRNKRRISEIIERNNF